MGVFNKKESESLIFTGLKILRDYTDEVEEKCIILIKKQLDLE